MAPSLFIFIQGNGFSGNSAVTDWLFDNARQNMDVIRGDFDDIRRQGSLIDIYYDYTPEFKWRTSLEVILRNSLRIKIRNILVFFGIKKGNLIERKRSESFLNCLLLVCFIRFIKPFQAYKNIVLYAAVAWLRSCSKKDIVVLNNPFCLCNADLAFLCKLNIPFIIAITHRNYISQYNSWKNLDFRLAPERYRKFSSSNPIDCFYSQQLQHLTSRKNQIPPDKCLDIEYERFISSQDYRFIIYHKLLGLDLPEEKLLNFNPVKSLINNTANISLKPDEVKLIKSSIFTKLKNDSIINPFE